MRSAIAVILLVTIPSISRAAFTDFSDHTGSQYVSVGDVFESGALEFRAVEFRPRNLFQPTWLIHEELIPGPGVEFLLPPNVQEVSLKFRDGAGLAFAINGVEPTYPIPAGGIFPAGFGFYDGTSLAGVSITTDLTSDFPTYEEGFLTLKGPLNSLVIAGLELGLDDITVRVPEPSAFFLVCLGGSVLAFRHVLPTAPDNQCTAVGQS